MIEVSCTIFIIVLAAWTALVAVAMVICCKRSLDTPLRKMSQEVGACSQAINLQGVTLKDIRKRLLA